ncbi:MAG: glycosyltransferase family 9 protein [Elusimicrobiota bacterium]|jgi:ADP-heptose:LPS heptosyltransferase
MRTPLIRLLWIGRLGDLLAATPFFSALRAKHPCARIQLVTGQHGFAAASLIEGIDEVLLLRSAAHPIRNLVLCARLRRERADLLVDLNASFSRAGWILALCSSAEEKLAFAKGRGDSAFDRRIPTPADDEHVLERYRRLAEALGAAYEPRLRVRQDPESDSQAERAFAGLGLGEGLSVGLFAGNFKKFDNRWPEERFVELARLLKSKPGIKPFFLAGPGEEEPIRRLAASAGIPAAGPFPIRITAAFLRRTDLIVTNATGTAHLAAAVNTPTFSLLSRYTRTVWMYPGPGQEGLSGLARHFSVVSQSWTSCRDIPVKDAWSALQEALDYARRASSSR